MTYEEKIQVQVLDRAIENPETGCLIFTGASSRGYGQVRIDYKLRGAHQLAWEAKNGPIPEGLVIRHYVCDNRRCVNVNHLKLGTQLDNLRDRDEKNRQAKGEMVGSAKLTEADVRDIRALKKNSNLTMTKIGQIFGVSRPNIKAIVVRQTWKHI